MLVRVTRSVMTVHRPVLSRALFSTFHSTHPSLMNAQLPYHLVVGLPALSPTMEVGTLAEWYVNEGDVFHAGDAIAKIETDKAAMDFEAQDDGVVAKLLVPAGNGADSYVSSM
jgi:Biotin-requiring enzyme